MTEKKKNELPKRKKKDANKVRILAETGSVQNNLRGVLYKEAFERIKKGNEQGNYFEVIALVDSVITDRLHSLLQHMRKHENDDYEYQSVGKMLQIFNSERNERNFVIPPEFETLINNQIGETWIRDRNFAAHSFVIVTNANKTIDKEERMEILKRCAINGEKYAKEMRTQTDKIIIDMYR